MGKYSFNGVLLKRATTVCSVASVYLALSGLALIWRYLNLEPGDESSFLHPGIRRDSRDLELGEEEALNCTPRSVDNFFGNFMTLEDTQGGGVFVHILIACYLIGAMALICDDYFVVSLERICEDLQIESDVAGATFMAAGSSAAEFFTSIIGVFIAKSDVGIGTIVGSAVFNLLFIIGICGIFAGVVVQLTWWPVFRDTVFYLFSVLALVLVIKDGVVEWFEAMSMLMMCIIYFVILAFNRKLEHLAQMAVNSFRSCVKGSADLEDNEVKTPLLQGKRKSISSEVVEVETSFSEVESHSTQSEVISESGEISPSSSDKSLPHHHSPWIVPESFFLRIFWVAMVPVKMLLYVTVPDCRRRTKWRKLYLVTFSMSVLWIAVFSYVLVWMVTIAGDALEIPDTVMGLTLLSAGTSVPDCLASLYVARDGLGDMAVSNSIASNVFNILMCLGLPWLLETAAVNVGETVAISSGALLYDSLILLVTVALLIAALFVNRWKLNVKLGMFCIFTYVIVIGVSCLFELNIFGNLNLPACPR
ncbi:sodium/potassium/calcium exchanger 4-like [Haliotis rubra]|uniref:sodium/potassium/calcium exchanger 4-like n=1 Tax=Haliotis rubra TaxID=36100 RepID=UPI001EE5A6BD|nr:sodium/potassium/calcium exchanger 4-like [Haliotis rubra]